MATTFLTWQFEEVHEREIDVIERTFRELNFEPEIVFIVSQKRCGHRFFKQDHKHDLPPGQAANVTPGTVQDTHVVGGPESLDFLLTSHHGLKGTSRTPHYHVLRNDAQLSSDQVQELIWQLAHLAGRTTKLIKQPAPTYAAHLLAEHFGLKEDRDHGRFSDTASVTSDRSDASCDLHPALRSRAFYM